ncbi:MAG: DMT family transporter [Lachnospiraceae bacterium]
MNPGSSKGSKSSGNPLFYGITGKQVLAFILSGIALGSNWIMLFESYGYTSVAISTVCNNMAPTIIILLSPFLFREKLSLRKFICIFVSVFGIFLISGIFQMESFGPADFIGIGLGLGSAVMYAALIILNKKNSVENVYGRTIIQLLAAGVFVIPYILLTEDFQTISLTTFSVIMVIVVCVLHTSIAYALYFGSMCHLKAQTVAFMSYMDPTFAIFLSVVLLKEEMNFPTFLGCALTIGAAIVSELPEKRKQLP